LNLDRLTDRELLGNLVFTQILFVVIGVVISLFLIESGKYFTLRFELFSLGLGLIGATGYISLSMVLGRYFAHLMGETDEANKRIFRNRTTVDIAAIALMVGISEEFLFRGIVQTHLGLWVATLIFILLHYRYFGNIIMTSSLIFISLSIGWIYEITGQILVSTIVMHTVFDFVLGMQIRNELRKIPIESVKTE
jgi:membrane protease YdiL (CAAX protease family)